jgi:hypothetical protein
MATDKEKLITLLTEFGLGFNITDSGVVTQVDTHKNTAGCTWFYAEYSFDKDGKFDKLIIAE